MGREALLAGIQGGIKLKKPPAKHSSGPKNTKAQVHYIFLLVDLIVCVLFLSVH